MSSPCTAMCAGLFVFQGWSAPLFTAMYAGLFVFQGWSAPLFTAMYAGLFCRAIALRSSIRFRDTANLQSRRDLPQSSTHEPKMRRSQRNTGEIMSRVAQIQQSYFQMRLPWVMEADETRLSRGPRILGVPKGRRNAKGEGTNSFRQPCRVGKSRKVTQPAIVPRGGLESPMGDSRSAIRSAHTFSQCTFTWANGARAPSLTNYKARPLPSERQRKLTYRKRRCIQLDPLTRPSAGGPSTATISGAPPSAG